MTDKHLLDLAVDIAVSYIANNPVPPSELPGLVPALYARLSTLGAPEEPPVDLELNIERPNAAQIRKSITPDALISFVDRKPYKTLKRHLGRHGLEPDSYRQRYGLPNDYPMVASNYAARRSALAKTIGLGRPGSRVRRAAE